ncbi:hypothetical protein IMG5_203750 [Ichthyophthirius multifiliis]|uniref:Uncharacterized protein n=1 Tax=Ichthyophthirius multifiliis TaxID=5932 RepID=G0R6D6_ICHMU|nr:hypothetical protein IMG5_203750 [Ichthyophthirius multifiliis]EGR26976.1 hypothetical protein IMG5_203750 [Ichthyophthirius multifiliis]|eukprot:XP_004023860.1 hypothetical protein IMG5_203750 [Ichthyophthirius multifiliis]
MFSKSTKPTSIPLKKAFSSNNQQKQPLVSKPSILQNQSINQVQKPSLHTIQKKQQQNQEEQKSQQNESQNKFQQKPSSKFTSIKTVDLFSKANNQNSNSFAYVYNAGGIPCRVNHGSIKMNIQWNQGVNLKDLPYDPLLATCFEGLTEEKHPYNFIAYNCTKEMLEQEDAGQKIVPMINKLVWPLKNSLQSKNQQNFDNALTILKLLSDTIGPNLNPHIKNILQPIVIQMNKQMLREKITITLRALEENGGADVVKIIKSAIPTYTNIIRMSSQLTENFKGINEIITQFIQQIGDCQKREDFNIQKIKSTFEIFTKNMDQLLYQINQDYENLEKVLQKHESDIRNRIRTEQQLKLFIESLQQKIEECEQEQRGILKEVRRALLGKDVDEVQDEQISQEDFDEPQEDFLHEGLSHDEFLRRAQKYQLQLFQKQIPDPFVKDQINSQYGNYSSYDRNYLQLKKIHQTVPKMEQIAYGQYKLHSFMKNNLLEQEGYHELWDDFQKELKDQKVQMGEDQALEEFYKFVEEVQKEDDEYVPEFEEMDNTNFDDPVEMRGLDDPRLSPKARDDIYELYQKGWSIKDICTRYGIIPERTKAVIWQCEKFYTQILPKADPLLVYLTYQMEEEWAEENGGWQDYGIDLEDLIERERGTHSLTFEKQREVDFGNPSKKWTKEEREQIKFRHTPKSEKITQKLDGGIYQRGYLIKDWKAHRGKCRQDVSRAFKRIVEHSHEPHRLPSSSILKLKNGPRIGAQGLGTKL